MRKTHYLPVTADVPVANEKAVAALIRKVIRTALAAEGMTYPCEVNVNLTDDAGIHEINREMRDVDRPTDVLSFPVFDLIPGELPDELDADPGTGLIPLGDMVISMEHAAAQAVEYGHSQKRELAYLVTHSVLHLLGYDHLDEGEQKKQMRAREEAILAELGITRED
ncbi:MAG: rRNA maturation RNase YbeY [Oscillibacter sp.]|nr:rRNA maturation RNase YbeY [Oscillibacter sp.]